MKIGIFGDSFACKMMRTHNRYKGHPGFDNIGKPWFELLPYDVTTYGVSGSDLFYSYNLYLKEKDKHDKTIFITTAPNRLSIKDPNNRFLHYNSHVIAEIHKGRSSGQNADFLESVIRYFKDILDVDKELILFNLMVNDIKKDKNCLIIKAFGEQGLKDVFMMENSAWNIQFKDNHSPGIKDFRYCHMTEQNNIIFSEQVKDCIDNSKEFVFDLTKFVKPSIEEKNRYIFNTEDLEVWLGDVNDRKNQ